MPYPVRSGCSKRSDGLIDVHAQAFNQITYDEVASPIESVMAVNADGIFVPSFGLCSGLLVLTNTVNL